ncbi:hypothetical protein [Aquimarina sp. 2201CG5-10]|uniref:hypothetical protein n=1 Tax=Aquimarina callyspongiae TaxID=3098150 RepID=UPI002AB3A44A|nr:hypothetical protein [Aquimarina sp. 2201CG5-10]MDY8136426.1 hypothetical protein [Aquimarina sp. 2201CG5-10]
MSTLISLIHTLSTEEKQVFTTFLKRKNKRHDTKNIQLFNLLDASPEIKNPDIHIYGKKAKGAYHALSKRLHDSIIDFIASKSFEGETSEEMEILKLLLASRILFEQKQYSIAFKIINKAEQKAKIYDLFSILNEIYYTQIQYAHLSKQDILPVLIQDFRANRQALLQEENLNLFYASIQNKLEQRKTNFLPVIKDTLLSFDISNTQDITFRSLFKLLEIINKTAHISRDYHSILPFIEETVTHIESKNKSSEKHLFYHIHILYYISNSYFRNRDFKTSQDYLDQMEYWVSKQNNKYLKRFSPQLTLLKALNLNYTGHVKQAILLVEEFPYKKHKDQITYVLDLELCLVVFYFQQSRYREALQIFKSFFHSDIWYIEKAGITWVIKKNLIEILLHLELENIDLVESRLRSFKKKHLSYLKDHEETRIITFLKLITDYYHNPETTLTENFRSTLKNATIINSTIQEDIFEISFYAWLLSKTHKTDLYETTLKLIQ